jgi:xylulokinase
MEPLIIGLDLGTTLCKAGVFELDGSICGFAQRNIQTFRPASGWAEQDPNEWVEMICQVLMDLMEQLGEDAKRVSVIGLSSHGPSLILTDEHFSPLCLSPIWQDQRAASLCSELIEKAGTGWVGLGMPESSFGVQLYWALINHPDLIQEAKYIFDVKGFLLAVLTGLAVDEPSSSPGGRQWNQQLFDVLGIDLRKLPNSVLSISIVDELSTEIRQRTGLPSGIKVVAGLNDGASATLGAGLVNLGQGIVSLSTNGVMRATIPNRLSGDILVKKSLFCYSYVDGMCVTGGTTKCGGDSVKWFIDNFLGGYRQDEAALFETVTLDAAKSPPGANGVMFMPYLMGVGTPNSRKDAEGAFLNLGRHHKRSDLTRALLEGVAFSLRDIGETFNELGFQWENIRFTGGGSKNRVWRQIVADILGKPLTGVRSDSVLGAAIVAAVGNGFYSTIRDAVTAMVHDTFQIEPDITQVKKYDHLYERFRKIKPALDEFLNKENE